MTFRLYFGPHAWNFVQTYSDSDTHKIKEGDRSWNIMGTPVLSLCLPITVASSLSRRLPLELSSRSRYIYTKQLLNRVVRYKDVITKPSGSEGAMCHQSVGGRRPRLTRIFDHRRTLFDNRIIYYINAGDRTLDPLASLFIIINPKFQSSTWSC